MKKKILLLGIFMIMLTGCSRDNNNDAMNSTMEQNQTEQTKRELYKIDINDVNFLSPMFKVLDYSIFSFEDGDLNLSFTFEDIAINSLNKACTPATGNVRILGHIYTSSDYGFCLYSYDGKNIKIYWKFTVTPGNWDYERTELVTGTFDKQYKTLTLDLTDVTFKDNDKYVLTNTAYQSIVNKLKTRNIDSNYIYYDKQSDALYDINGLKLFCDSDSDCEKISISDAIVQDYDNYKTPVKENSILNIEEIYKSKVMGKCFTAEDGKQLDGSNYDLTYCFSKSKMYKGKEDFAVSNYYDDDYELSIKAKDNNLYINNKKVNIVYNDENAYFLLVDDIIFEFDDYETIWNDYE